MSDNSFEFQLGMTRGQVERQRDIDNRSREYRETGGAEHDYSSDRPVTADTYDTVQLQEQFTVHAFAAPFISVTRKSDGKKGTLEFKHSPRVYFNFQESV